jgi:hypothetical protein
METDSFIVDIDGVFIMAISGNKQKSYTKKPK